VLVDAHGSKKSRRKMLPRLAAAGIAAHLILPAKLLRFRRARMDLRNHRKIAVIDGRIGYTGSQNLVDPDFKKGLTYEELVARITGPVVLELQYVFVADWFLEADELLDSEAIFPSPALTGGVPAQVLPSGPQFPTQNNQRLLVDLLYGARRRVVIVTPYFVPDEPFLQALQTAVLRGVEVHLVVSGQMDQWLVGLAQRSYYAQLLEDRVHVHLYRQLQRGLAAQFFDNLARMLSPLL
jgi:cardiolipin synthase